MYTERNVILTMKPNEIDKTIGHWHVNKQERLHFNCYSINSTLADKEGNIPDTLTLIKRLTKVNPIIGVADYNHVCDNDGNVLMDNKPLNGLRNGLIDTLVLIDEEGNSYGVHAIVTAFMYKEYKIGGWEYGLHVKEGAKIPSWAKKYKINDGMKIAIGASELRTPATYHALPADAIDWNFVGEQYLDTYLSHHQKCREVVQNSDHKLYPDIFSQVRSQMLEGKISLGVSNWQFLRLVVEEALKRYMAQVTVKSCIALYPDHDQKLTYNHIWTIDLGLMEEKDYIDWCMNYWVVPQSIIVDEDTVWEVLDPFNDKTGIEYYNSELSRLRGFRDIIDNVMKDNRPITQAVFNVVMP